MSVEIILIPYLLVTALWAMFCGLGFADLAHDAANERWPEEIRSNARRGARTALRQLMLAPLWPVIFTASFIGGLVRLLLAIRDDDD